MMQLILVRHGETSKNVKNKLHRCNDLEMLSDTGIKQIRKTVNRIKELNPTTIYCSKEKRALQSAEILSKELGVPCKQIDGIQERNWGMYSGKSWSEVQVVLETMTLDERYNFIPPQGESWKQFEKRLIKALEQTLENEGQSVVIVTHGGVIRALMPYLLAISRDKSFNYDPANASLTIFKYEDGVFSKVVINDTTHLT